MKAFPAYFSLTTLLRTAHHGAPPRTSVETVWRRPILNTQGGVLFWVDSPVWSEQASDGEGCCQSETGDRDSSFLRFLFPLPPTCPLSSAPQSPDDNGSALAAQPGWDFYRHARHWGCQDNELKAPQAHISTGARSVWPSTLSALSQSPPRTTQSYCVALLNKAQRAEVISLWWCRLLACAIVQSDGHGQFSLLLISKSESGGFLTPPWM